MKLQIYQQVHQNSPNIWCSFVISISSCNFEVENWIPILILILTHAASLNECFLSQVRFYWNFSFLLLKKCQYLAYFVHILCKLNFPVWNYSCINICKTSHIISPALQSYLYCAEVFLFFCNMYRHYNR